MAGEEGQLGVLLGGALPRRAAHYPSKAREAGHRFLRTPSPNVWPKRSEQVEGRHSQQDVNFSRWNRRRNGQVSQVWEIFLSYAPVMWCVGGSRIVRDLKFHPVAFAIFGGCGCYLQLDHRYQDFFLESSETCDFRF